VKTALQIIAEKLAQEFKKKGRKPVVIEFAGTPKAGKTTTLSTIQAFLKRCGFKVEVVVERASVSPVRDKYDATFNVWTACTTLAQILEKTQDPPREDDPDILILDEPTRGIDVGAKYEIYTIINQLASEGKGIIFISSELPEILGICDRIYVMRDGKIVGEMPASEASQEIVMTHIMTEQEVIQ
jgi:ABC-type multidrug transport system ATPase subunit